MALKETKQEPPPEEKAPTEEKKKPMPNEDNEVVIKEDVAKYLDADLANRLFESLACNTFDDSTKNGTDKACLRMLQRFGYDCAGVKTRYLASQKHFRFEFDPNRKRMTTIIVKDSSRHLLYIKGAAEQIVPTCDFYEAQGRQVPITEEYRQRILEQIENYNRTALRTIAVAYKEVIPGEFGEEHDEHNDAGGYRIEDNKLIFLCLLGIRDTLRDGVKKAVQTCHAAGINVKMVTGDNKTTAQVIAEECGILKSHEQYSVMEGKDFSAMLGGLYKHCEGCNKEIAEKDLQEYKEKKKAEERQKKAEKEKKKREERERLGKSNVPPAEAEAAGNGDGDGDDDDDEPDLEKQEMQEDCPYCHEKKVADKVRNIGAFKDINAQLCVLARSKPLDKLLLVTALKELYYLMYYV